VDHKPPCDKPSTSGTHKNANDEKDKKRKQEKKEPSVTPKSKDVKPNVAKRKKHTVTLTEDDITSQTSHNTDNKKPRSVTPEAPPVEMDDVFDMPSTSNQTSGQAGTSRKRGLGTTTSGIKYIVLGANEKNGFQRGHRVERVHDVIRNPDNPKKFDAIVKFVDKRHAQLIDLDQARLHAPNALAVALQKKLDLVMLP
jgi:hypothetical protein